MADVTVASSDAPYEYGELGDREIRLINLDSKPAPDGSSVEYAICTFRPEAEDAPEYYALSYCWGESHQSERILCNATSIPVTPHLKQGLEELGSLATFRTWFWIDQVCVNQQDTTERSRQVQLMPTIYTCAIRTVVWTGPRCDGNVPEAEDESIFSLAASIYAICQQENGLSEDPNDEIEPGQHTTEWQGRLPAWRGIRNEDDLVRFGLPQLRSPLWLGLAAFFSTPWFSRIWVVQEAVLSQRIPHLVHDGQLRDFLHMLWAGAFLAQNRGTFTASRLKTDEAYLAIVGHAFLILELAIARSQWTLGSLLWTTSKYKATDNRDKFFALLSISSNLKSISSRLLPDYAKPLSDVGRDFTRHVIQASNSLLVLSLINNETVEPPDQDAEGNNWNKAPSWAYIPSNEPGDISFGESYGTIGYPYNVTRPEYSAWINASVTDLPVEDPNVLTLEGRYIDSIAEVCGEQHGLPKLLSWCVKGYQHVARPGAAGSRKTDLEFFLARFFVAVAAMYEYATPRPSISDFKAWLRSLPGCIPNVPASFRELARAATNSTTRDDIGAGGAGSGTIMSRWVEMHEPGGKFGYRGFAVTRKGLLVVGPRGMRKGDVLCLFRGGEMAYVVRRLEDKCLFIGEAFVHELNLQDPESDYWKGGYDDWFHMV
ncbi:hypothetical protein MKZ38_007263 [Zalerion maritima]|uniref:Heterokaryon incompatibility domain-containing protein n=1 Tax=Zalerion maritima TaxID=339359 RepID=A0AAD5RW18_9PEZI|nr:hypothetical protein MKZ38_007263 [Zalerion maritima]